MFHCFFRVGTSPDLRFDLFEGVFQTILTLLQSDITGRGSLGKGSSEIESGKILSCLMRNHGYRSSRRFRRNTNLGKVCIEFLYFVLITRLAYLVPLGSGGRWFDVLTLSAVSREEILVNASELIGDGEPTKVVLVLIKDFRKNILY